MLTYTCLLAIACTDECFNNKLTHFELHLFIATICCHGWNILFILEGEDWPADNMQEETPKNYILCLFGRWCLTHKMMTVLSEWCDVSERERRVCSSSLLLHHGEWACSDPICFPSRSVYFPSSCSGMWPCQSVINVNQRSSSLHWNLPVCAWLIYCTVLYSTPCPFHSTYTNEWDKHYAILKPWN